MKFRAILSSKAHPGCRQATKAVQDCGTSVVAVTVQDQHSTMTLQLPADSLAGCRGHVDWAATGTEDRWRFWEAIGLRPPSAKRCCLSPPSPGTSGWASWRTAKNILTIRLFRALITVARNGLKALIGANRGDGKGADHGIQRISVERKRPRGRDTARTSCPAGQHTYAPVPRGGRKF